MRPLDSHLHISKRLCKRHSEHPQIRTTLNVFLSSVSTLVLFASEENDQSFEAIIKDQIKKLRKQLDKPQNFLTSRAYTTASLIQSIEPNPPKPDVWESARTKAAQIATSLGQTGRIFTY